MARDRIDTKAIKRMTASDINAWQAALPPSSPLTRDGLDWIALCPFHSEKTPSFKIKIGGGFFKCFGCGKSGDILDLRKHTKVETFLEAAKHYHNAPSIAAAPQQTQKTTTGEHKLPSKNAGTPAIFAPRYIADLEAKGGFAHYTHGKPKMSHSYCYVDRNTGKLCVFAMQYRYITAKGGKSFAPLSLRGGKPVQRRPLWTRGEAPLYGMERIALARQKYPHRPVIVVEGEKAADSLYERLMQTNKRCAVVSWMGGCGSARRVDVRPLRSCVVILWADADEAGKKAMQDISRLVRRYAKKTIVLIPPTDWAKGTDAADLTIDECFAFLRTARQRT